MRQYDELALEPEFWPKNATEVRENPDNLSRVPFVFFDKDGSPLCSSKRAGWTPEKPSYCGGDQLMAGGRCRMHGGKTGPTGQAHPNYKHGRYVGSLPARLAAQFEEAMEDPELMSLKKEVGLIDTKVADLLMSASEGGAHTIFKELVKQWRSFKGAEMDGDVEKMTDAGRNIDYALEEGANEALVWEQINKLMEMRRKMVLAEGKRLQMMDQFITVTEANLLLGTMVAIVVREVSDRGQIANILAEFQKLTGERGAKAVPQGQLVASREVTHDGEIEYE